MQIRTRLTIQFTGIAAIVLAAVLAYAWWSYKTQNEADFYANLESKANITAYTALSDPDQFRPLPVTWIRPEGDSLPYKDNVSLYNVAFERVFTMKTEAPPISIRMLHNIVSNSEFRFKNRNLHAFGKVVNGPDGLQFMVVTEGYFNPDRAENLARILGFAFLIGLVAFAGLGWYFAGLALAPVTRIVQNVDEIQPGDLSRRISVGEGRDELSRLSATFNRLLERVEKAFQMQRMFLSNISHELRNPLTAVRTQIDVVLQRDRSNEEYKTALQSTLEEVKEISEMEEKLLLLAKVYNSPDSIPVEEIRLDELLWQARESSLKNRPGSEIALELSDMPEQEADLIVTGNESLLRTALCNLLENGCKYSNNNRARMRMKREGEHSLLVEIENEGEGIPESERNLIFQPFYRSPAHQRVKGSGIGLSLVRSILDFHGIPIELDTEQKERTIFRMKFSTLKP